MNALERGLDARYTSAVSMKDDLTEYLDQNGNEDDKSGGNGSSHSTLDFLLRKIRYKSDFPTFSHNIMEITQTSFRLFE